MASPDAKTGRDAETSGLAPQEACEGFVSLFDGKSLKGWIGATDAYFVEDGRLISREDAHGNLFTEKEYADFVLRFEFRLTPGANNGLAIRSPLRHGSCAYKGMEIQILDDTAPKYAKLKPYQFHGSIYGIVPARRGALKPVGEWNQQEVICCGRRVKVILNGVTIVDADLDEAAAQGTMDGKDHPGLKRRTGHIGWLGHRSRVELRRIRIKELPKCAEEFVAGPASGCVSPAPDECICPTAPPCLR
ncbi:MAG: DUF1080 domain-containing protein [Planctomycetes bacterium]|nr:DUF1080 domain-containing protein [Planctomycetota bacterium]